MTIPVGMAEGLVRVLEFDKVKGMIIQALPCKHPEFKTLGFARFGDLQGIVVEHARKITGTYHVSYQNFYDALRSAPIRRRAGRQMADIVVESYGRYLNPSTLYSHVMRSRPALWQGIRTYNREVESGPLSKGSSVPAGFGIEY